MHIKNGNTVGYDVSVKTKNLLIINPPQNKEKKYNKIEYNINDAKVCLLFKCRANSSGLIYFFMDIIKIRSIIIIFIQVSITWFPTGSLKAFAELFLHLNMKDRRPFVIKKKRHVGIKRYN